MAIVIAGGSGLIGQEITSALLKKNYEVRILSRSPESKKSMGGESYFKWDIKSQSIDESVFNNAECVINLTGENVADKRWTDNQKEKLLNSRIDSTNLLLEKLKNLNSKAKFINASAIGFYGDTEDKIVDETAPSGDDFLAGICQEWEKAIKKSEYHPYIIIRIGIVLSLKGGALSKMLTPFKLGLGGALGSGQQYMSWIHIDDLVKIFLWAMESDTENQIFNAVAPNPVTNKEFTKTLGSAISRPTIFNAPSMAIKLALGEMSTILLKGQRVSSQKLQDHGFKFEYQHLKNAFEELI